MPLSPEFIDCLITGHLAPLHRFLLRDATLCPEIRKDGLSVYYRGGRLLKVSRSRLTWLVTILDKKYLRQRTESDGFLPFWQQKIDQQSKQLVSNADVLECLRTIPFMKAVMDGWFSEHPKPEREAQQIFVWENNQNPASDFFVCTTERADDLGDNVEGTARFDFVGVHWQSTGAERKRVSDRPLVLGEIKYGDGAYAGRSGLVKHAGQVRRFLNHSKGIVSLKDEMALVFKQLWKLGFIKNTHPLESFSKTSRPIWMLVFINHDPEKTVLLREVRRLKEFRDFPADIRISTASCMGYGLFDQTILNLDEFLARNMG